MFTPGSRPCAYRTASGRAKWPNRDPIEEYGGINLYDFVGDDPVSFFDLIGLHKDYPDHDAPGHETVDSGHEKFALTIGNLDLSGTLWWRKVCCNKKNSRSWNVGQKKRIFTLDLKGKYSDQISLRDKYTGPLGPLLVALEQATHQKAGDFGIKYSGEGTFKANYDQCIEGVTGNPSGGLEIKGGVYGITTLGRKGSGYYLNNPVDFTGTVKINITMKQRSVVLSAGGKIDTKASYEYEWLHYDGKAWKLYQGGALLWQKEWGLGNWSATVYTFPD